MKLMSFFAVLVTANLFASPVVAKPLAEAEDWKALRLENARRQLLDYIAEESKGGGLPVDLYEPKNRFIAIVPTDESFGSFYGIAWEKRDRKMSRFAPRPLLITLIRTAHPHSALLLRDNVAVVDEDVDPAKVLPLLPEAQNSAAAAAAVPRRGENSIEDEIILRLTPFTQRASAIICRRVFAK